MSELEKREKRFEAWYLEQRGEEWAKKRDVTNDVYSASNIPSILSCGYDSVHRFWEIKTHRFQKTDFKTAAMIKGIADEPEAMNYFTEITGEPLVQPGSLRHKDYPFITASLDGLSFNVTKGTLVPVEFKIPVRLPEIKQNVQEKYIIQVMVQMACTSTKEAVLFFYENSDKENPKYELYTLKWFPLLWDYILEEILIFKKMVDEDIEPPKRNKKKDKFIKLMSVFYDKYLKLKFKNNE